MKLLNKPYTQEEISRNTREVYFDIQQLCTCDNTERVIVSLGFAINKLSMIAYSRIKELNQGSAVKPNLWGDGYDDKGELIYDMYDCPGCGRSYEIDYEKYDYCPNCGQAIDWSGIDE